MIVKAMAPARVCDFGGWTDTWFAKYGRVMNIAVDLYAKVVITPHKEVGSGVRIIVQDYNDVVEIPSDAKIFYNGKHDLLKAALNVIKVDDVDISIYSDLPPGCGTGSSAAVSVALIGALSQYAGMYLTPHEVAKLAHRLETEELKIQSGVQDQVASAVGGIGFHEIDAYPHVASSPVRIKEDIALELESRLLVVYTGQSHLSSEVHEKVISDYTSGKEKTIKAMDTLRETPVLAKSAIIRGDFNEFAEVMNLNTNAQKDLHPDITNDNMERLESIARGAGAIGYKINGAGGGGSVTVLSKSKNAKEVETAIKNGGYKVLRSHLDTRGLVTWSLPDDGNY